MRKVKAAPQATGRDVREFRRDLNWNQERLAALLGVSKAYIQQIESASDPAPLSIAERIFGARQLLLLAEALRTRVADQQPRNFHDFRRSRNFASQPPFSVLPRCQCGNPRCNLTPVKDGEWDGKHLWKFQGIRCRQIVYVNTHGKIVPAPRDLTRDAALRARCSQCGRQRDLARKFRPRLGTHVVMLYCRRRKGDTAGLKHDAPELFMEEKGHVRALTLDEVSKLRGRSTRGFAVPKCDLEGCSRHGKTMERSAVLRLKDDTGIVREVATYRCRPPKPATAHAEYRVLPRGELAMRIELGRYRWKDAETSEQRETFRRERPIRKNRVMPTAKCAEHKSDIISISGPWPIRVKDLRGRRGRGGRVTARMQCWRARCSEGNELVYVRSDGSITAAKASRWENRRAIPKSTKEKARNEYKAMLPAVRGIRDFLKKIVKAPISSDEKMRHFEAKLNEFSSLRTRSLDFKTHLGDALLNPKGWTSEVLIEILAPLYRTTPDTFARKFLHPANS